MKSFFKVFLYVILFFLVLFLQFSFFNNFDLFGAKFNLIVAFLFAFNSKNNIYISCILSFIIGFFMDSLYLNNLLIYTIIFTLISLFINFVKDKYKFNDLFTSILPIIISFFVYNIINYGYFVINTSTHFSLFYFIIYNILSISINLFATLVLYSVLDKLDTINYMKKSYFD